MSEVNYRDERPTRKRATNVGHWMHTPSWWINYKMTRPQRRKVKALLHQVQMMPLDNLEDAPLFPLAKKPHDYYW